MKVFRNWMTTSLSAPEARNLRDSFIPSFPNSGFDLVCPQVDSSFSRRFKDIKTPEMSKAEATERSLKAEQYKILDVARPLLFLREKIAESADLKDSPLAEAADTALRLWGHTFHNVTTSRRENLLKVSDPKFLSLLKEPHRFKPRECASLFGRHFIKNMVKEATDDQTLRSISSSHGSSSRPRAGSSGYRGSSRSHRGGNFGQGGYSNGYNGGSSGTFNRSRGNHSIRSENLSLHNYSLESPPIVGGRLRHFVDSWKCLSSDPWIVQSISQGVKLEFLASPFQARNQSNMEMGESQWALCNQEIQDLVRKEAIEPVEESEQCFVSGMEGVSSLQEIIRPDDFFTKIDLKDAYLTVPLHQEDRKFIQISNLLISKTGLTQWSRLCTRHFDPGDIVKGKTIKNIFYPNQVWQLQIGAFPKHCLGITHPAPAVNKPLFSKTIASFMISDKVYFTRPNILYCYYTFTEFREPTAKVVIIGKPNKPAYDSLNCFRPISVINTLAKVLEKLILSRIRWVASTHQRLSPSQHGFTLGRSTESAAHSLISFCESSNLAKCTTACAFLDIKSAFDAAWHPAIISALDSRNCPRYLTQLILSFLSDRTAFFSLNESSLIVNVGLRCPQGGVLSPFLWSVLIDDVLRLCFPFISFTVAFADDLTVAAAHKDPTIATRNLQIMCDQANNWCLSKKMSLNASKTVFMLVNKKLIDCWHLSLVINGLSICPATETVFLGLTVDSRLNWQAHVNRKIAAAKRAFFFSQSGVEINGGLRQT
ncbi:Uncharacterized protein APZ42_033066 [Daphnia magna]|uniref:Reverse transcriptase domain-containing protein n=1 Tax=Daphnia magna TaxID=35525 RepID=A0A164LFJ6_9CRUS|nr:Uncharacterized protein APZ42_033066 [Daphnia magna]